MGVTHILLVDDHTVIRAGLRLVLERQSDFRVVEEAADGREAVAAAERLKPDIVVMDLLRRIWHRHRGVPPDCRRQCCGLRRSVEHA